MIIELNSDIELVFVGDIHEQQSQFEELLEKIKPSSQKILVSLGDVYDKGLGPDIAEAITDKMMDLHRQGQLLAVKGNHEMKNINKNKQKGLSPQLRWWKQQPLSLSFRYPNQSMVTCLHAGLTPSATWESIRTHSEVLYVRNIDENGKMIRLKWIEEDGKKILVEEKPNGTSWHQLYDGRFGYVFSGHQQQLDGIPKFYNHSCNLDTACYMTGILTAQTFSSIGRGETIQISGTAVRAKH